MTLSKLRPPNFTLSSKSDEGFITNIDKDDDNNNLLSLSSYTSKCQQQLLLTVSESSSEVDNDHNDTNNDVSYNNGQDTDNNKTNKESSNEPNMEQCILLLESHLSGFQRGCRQKDDKLHGKKKKRRKEVDHDHTPPTQQQLLPNFDGDGTEEQYDDVPPQLLRLARFFHYRWLPIKRALLRPVANNNDMSSSLRDQQSTLIDNENTRSNQHPQSSVEVGLEYRLRLAKACWKQGLVAAAEYEMLTASLDKVLHPRNIDEDSTGGLASNVGVQSNDCGDGDNLLERVRMALLRLPTDATIKSTISSTSHSHATAVAAWRHAKEMILKCCQYWEENGVTISMLIPSVKVLEEDEAETFNELVSRVGIPKVVDWALTSWTALLLSQGVNGFATDSSFPVSSNSTISKIERDFASLLSNRSQSINNESNPFELFSVSVSNRINEILSNSCHLKQMSGIHLVGLARLLASFHSRANAEEHIVTSIITSAMMKGGGMDVLDPLSRLLAIYCCHISVEEGKILPEDNLVGSTASRSTAADLERRLRSKLNDVAFVDGVLASYREGETEEREDEVLQRIKSFMEVLFTMTVHFVKCGGRK